MPGNPPMPPIPGIPGMPPRVICCMKPRIFWKSASTLSTSAGVWPQPEAMRRRREGEAASRSGSCRSPGVIEPIIASIFWSCCSPCLSMPSSILFMPGISFISPPREPMRLIMRICCTKSEKSKLASCSFCCMRATSASSTSFWAFSTRVSTSPMPRMRLAIRSGWKGCSASTFSPVPMNLIGAPLTLRIERAAPPRESPSSLVSTAPVIPTRSWKARVSSAASWPIMASTTSSTSSGWTASRIRTISPIIDSSIWSRPAVSTSTVSKPCSRPRATPAAAISSGRASAPRLKTSTPICCPRVRS